MIVDLLAALFPGGAWEELDDLLSPAELLRRGEGEAWGALFLSPAELLLEKGQKDRGEMGNRQLEAATAAM